MDVFNAGVTSFHFFKFPFSISGEFVQSSSSQKVQQKVWENMDARRYDMTYDLSCMNNDLSCYLDLHWQSINTRLWNSLSESQSRVQGVACNATGVSSIPDHSHVATLAPAGAPAIKEKAEIHMS